MIIPLTLDELNTAYLALKRERDAMQAVVNAAREFTGSTSSLRFRARQAQALGEALAAYDKDNEQ